MANQQEVFDPNRLEFSNFPVRAHRNTTRLPLSFVLDCDRRLAIYSN